MTKEERKLYMREYMKRKGVKEKAAKQNKIYRQTSESKAAKIRYNESTKGKEVKKLYNKIYRQTDDGKLAAKTSRQKRREIKNGIALNYYKKSDRLYTLDLFKNECFNCMSKDNIEVDHHKPLSQKYGLSRTNAVLLCRSCNGRKSNKNPKDFYTINQIKILEESYGIIS